jgi:hypothetical protein
MIPFDSQKKSWFVIAVKFHIFRKPLNINLLHELLALGIQIANIQVKRKFWIIFNDKAKPRAIVGRKATGPSGMAGLPKSDQRNRITVASFKMGIRFLF